MSALDLAIQLTKDYFHHIEDVEGSIQQSALCIQEMQKGASLESIEKWIRTWMKNHPHHIRHLEHIGQLKELDSQNLLYPHSVGYHRLLRSINQPTRMQYRPEVKSFVREKSVYENKRISRFTLQDLLVFWQKSMQIRHADKSDLGRFRYLLSKYELDIVLYAIDELAEQRKDDGKRHLPFVLDLERFIPMAMERLEEKKNSIEREKLIWNTNSF